MTGGIADSRRAAHWAYAARHAQYRRDRNDATPFNFMQSQQAGFSGTALAAFGSADAGVPAP
jgi:hypothetical protein